MNSFASIDRLTPERFELQVKAWLESVSSPLEAFVATHQDKLSGHDGDYTIDITARFRTFGGASFLVVIECKKHKNPIKREAVQALRAKQSSLGAHKALIVATAPFQRGTVKYAGQHGIALVEVISGSAVYIQNSGLPGIPVLPESSEDFAGLFYGDNPKGDLVSPQLLTSGSNQELALYLNMNC